MKGIQLFVFVSFSMYTTTLDCQSTHLYSPESTANMANILMEIYLTADPMEYYHLNGGRAQKYLERRDTSSHLINWVPNHFLYCQELLNAGYTDSSIVEILYLLDKVGRDYPKITQTKKPIYDLLGIAYMRKGEQENCIENHSSESCIVPIENSGLHTIRSGSENAIVIYELILSSFPDDLNARWLYNIAHMTLNQYPEKVNPKYYLPIGSDATFPKFKNIAMHLDVAVNGLSGGVCVEDFDRDGDIDILASSYGMNHQIQFFNNIGDGTFVNLTESAGLNGVVSGLNMIHADYNNDGYADILVLRGGWLEDAGTHPNSLLKNNGNGTFRDVTVESGVYSEYPTQTAAWADINLDGHLDLFIGNETTNNLYPCEMYLNLGDGTFKNIALESGLNVTAYVKGSSWGDVNNDGLPDLYLSILGGDNLLFVNTTNLESGNITFTETGKLAGITEPFFSFPTWFWDYNNDGWDDIFVSGYDITRLNKVPEDEARILLEMEPKSELPRLYKNNGDGTFSNVTEVTGINIPMYTMGSNFGDINNDGFLDFYVGTGTPDYTSIVPNKMFVNHRGSHFEDVTYAGGFGHIQKGHGVGFADFDNDGDQDLYAVMGGAFEGDVFQNVLFDNPGNQNHWINLALEGTESNRSAIGAKVIITILERNVERKIYQTVNTGGSFGSSTLQLEFGLGKVDKILLVEVRWPLKDGYHMFKSVKPNRNYLIKEGSQRLKVIKRNILKRKLANYLKHHH